MANMEQALQYRDAVRQQCKASILIEGLTGRGKSGLALLLAKALAGGDYSKVYAIDTENKSLDLFEGLQMSDGAKCTPFKVVNLLPVHGYSPSNYLTCKDNAVRAGGLVCVNDSITHMWQQDGGLLDLVDRVKKSNKTLNQWTAWGEESVKKEKQAIFSTIRDPRIHVISTVRVKEKFEMVTEQNGKSALKSLGEQEQQMPDLKYEPDLVLSMESAGKQDGTPPIARVVKSRYAILPQDEIVQFTPAIIDTLVRYLSEGADPAELREKQRVEYIGIITSILDADVSKKTMFPMLKQQYGHKDTKLTDLPLDIIQMLFGALQE